MKSFIYNPAHTPVHRLQPTTKIIALLACFTIAMCFTDPVYLSWVFAGVLTIVFVSKSWNSVWSLRYLLILLFFFPMLLWSAYIPGPHPAVGKYILPVSENGLYYGLSMGLRLDSMLIAGLVLLNTTRVEAFTFGLQRLGLPYRISFSLTLAFRLVPIFFNTFEIISQAQKARGHDIRRGNILVRIKKSLPLFIPVFISGIRRTDKLAIALESRGFGFPGKRTSFVEYAMRLQDKCVTFFAILFALSAVYARISGFGKI